MSTEIRIPSAGESITEVQIGQWLKSPGDRVEADEVVVEIETDKASMEVPAPAGGVLASVMKQEGEIAQVGDVIATIEPVETGGAERPASGKTGSRDETEDEPQTAEPAANTQKTDRPPQPEETPEPEAKPQPEDRPAPAAASAVMPAAQRLLDEHQVPADKISGSGRGGRILKEDVQKYLDQHGGNGRESAQPAELPIVGDREEQAVPMSMLRRRIAERLVDAQNNAALLTTFNEIDMSAVMTLRGEHKERFEKEYNVKLGFMSFFTKAVVDGLKTYPQINAEVRGTDIIYKNYFDIGIAVSTERGLVVPVLRHAERLSFAEIEKTIGDFARRARANKLTIEELQGGTFTITNGGIFGSLLSTPIINPPQSGVLGLHAIQDRPVAVDGQVVVRPMMYVALTYDHRIVDGREAVSFLRRIKECIEAPARMLIEV